MFILTMIDAMPINYGGATVGVAEAGSIRECFSVEMRGSFTYASIDGGEILIAESDNNIIHGTYEANPAYQEPPTTEGAKKKSERQTAQAVLVELVGLDVDKMPDKQLRKFISVLGKLAGLLDDKNKVKSIN